MKYFTISELTRSSTAAARGIDNTPPADVVTALTALVERVLDPLRETYGAPIRIGSGYRCPALNKAVKGAANSQHMRGQAADIDVGSREGNRRLFELIEKRGLYDQLIDEYNFDWVHVSYRADDRNRKQILKIR